MSQIFIRMETIGNCYLREHHLSVIENAKSFMEANFNKRISLQQISSYCNTSPFHFSRIFKEATNRSPYQYLLFIRLSHAELLLISSSKTITDICFESGFNSLEHFATIFRRKFKRNPSAYRRFRMALIFNVVESDKVNYLTE